MGIANRQLAGFIGVSVYPPHAGGRRTLQIQAVAAHELLGIILDQLAHLVGWPLVQKAAAQEPSIKRGQGSGYGTATGCGRLFPIDGGDPRLRNARGVCVPRGRHRPAQKSGQCARQDPGRFRNLDDGVLRYWIHTLLRRVVSRERSDDQHRSGLSPGQILLPRNVRCRRTGDHFRRHRRARADSCRSVWRRR